MYARPKLDLERMYKRMGHVGHSQLQKMARQMDSRPNAQKLHLSVMHVNLDQSAGAASSLSSEKMCLVVTMLSTVTCLKESKFHR